MQCSICQCSEFRAYKFGLERCNGCGLVVSPAISNVQVNEWNEEWFGDGYNKSSFWVRRFENWNNRRTLKRLGRSFLSGKRLLEIGLGSGSFLKAASDAGAEVLGCDLSPAICLHAQKTYGVTVHCGPLSTLQEANEFQVVVMNHVLEHVQDPVGFLREVHRRLAPGGIVHIAVPNLSCLEAILSGWTSYEPYHLAYFEPRTLTRTVTQAGLAVERLQTLDSFSGWFLAILRTLLGVNRQPGAIVTRSANDNGRQPWSQRKPWVEHTYRLSMVITGVVIWPLRWVQSLLGVGDELICLAYKPSSKGNVV